VKQEGEAHQAVQQELNAARRARVAEVTEAIQDAAETLRERNDELRQINRDTESEVTALGISISPAPELASLAWVEAEIQELKKWISA